MQLGLNSGVNLISALCVFLPYCIRQDVLHTGAMGCEVWGVGCGVWGVGFGVWIQVWGAVFGGWCLVFGVWYLVWC
jgi:hypothetical protein